MKLNFTIPEPVIVRATYDDVEIFRRELAPGEHDFKIECPQKSGVCQAFLTIGDKPERGFGSLTYYFDDLRGAQLRVARANEMMRDGKKQQNWKARSWLLEAVELFKKHAPDSDDLADACLSMCWVHFGALRTCRPHRRAFHRDAALNWYEKAIAVWERNGNTEKLAGNLTNISAMYLRFGDPETCLARAVRGLELERQRSAFDDESIHSWTHAAGAYVRLGRLDEGEAVIADGLARFGESSPSCAYLYDIHAQIENARGEQLRKRASEHDERAAQLRKRAEELLPPDSCALS